MTLTQWQLRDGYFKTGLPWTRTWIPTTAILYQFEKLTSNKSIMKEDANFVAYNAEIMLKVGCDVNPVGVAELNAELGYKMLPKRT